MGYCIGLGIGLAAVPVLAQSPAPGPPPPRYRRGRRPGRAAAKRVTVAQAGPPLPPRRRRRAAASTSQPGAPHTLAEALAATYSNQPALQAERAKLRATDENVPQALAGWRPTVVLAGRPATATA